MTMEVFPEDTTVLNKAVAEVTEAGSKGMN